MPVSFFSRSGCQRLIPEVNAQVATICAIILLAASSLNAQELSTNDPLKRHMWRASWIGPSDHSLKSYGVFLFRKTFALEKKPETFVIHLSADNRYVLFVNGHRICAGPATGDLHHWYYDTIDISEWLRQGDNVIAAQVHNFGEHLPGRQISFKTSLILQADNEVYSFVDSDRTWKVCRNDAYQPLAVTPERIPEYYRVFGFYTAGPGDRLDGSVYPWGWESPGFMDQSWKSAIIIGDDAVNKGVNRGYAWGSMRYLVPRPIKMLREQYEQPFRIVRSSGLTDKPGSLGKRVVIPAGVKASILLDAQRMSIGYPEIRFAGGQGASINVTYAESLFDQHLKKGNRNEIRDKEIYGMQDLVLPDGGQERIFRPLWMRAFRYIQLDIVTGAEQLVLNGVENLFTAYPLDRKASIQTSDPRFERILDAGWRTLQLCAQDNFFSDAYFEQMQYVGDARTQAMATWYMTGNDDLYRHAIRQIHYSRIPEGLTQSRYPARELQVIPSYSLAWIGLIYDHMMLVGDTTFMRTFLPGMRNVIEWFEDRVDDSGLLSGLDWWYFADREPTTDGGYDNQSSLATLQFSDALRMSAALFRAAGSTTEAERFARMSDQLNQNVYGHCYRNETGLFSESPLSNVYSQGTQAMAIVSGAAPRSHQKTLIKLMLQDKSVRESTLYYRFYISKALEKAPDKDLYFTQLFPWEEMLKNGMTTFGEVAVNPRSDCHPWSAIPNIDFFTIVCGVRPLSFGGNDIVIEPTLGSLRYLKARIPHAFGEIVIDLQRERNNRLKGTVKIPENVTAHFMWNDTRIDLTGETTILINGK